jgi:hypothetical protein
MIHHMRPSVTRPDVTLLEQTHSQEKNKFSLPHMLILLDQSSVAAYLSIPFPTTRCRITALCPSQSTAPTQGYVNYLLT